MSMWLNYAKLSPSTFEKAKKTPSLVESLFFSEAGAARPADFDSEADVFGEDYRTISAVTEAMDEAGVPHEWLDKAMGDGAGDELAYEFCYGPGFALSPAEVKTIAKELGKEGDGFGIAEFFAEAAKQGKGIVGGVS